MEGISGKVAIITGSTSGIGRAAAILLAKHGAKIVVTGRNTVQGDAVVSAIQLDGGEAVFVKLDLADAASPALLVRQALEQWGRLDIIVNNAALICNKPIELVAHADWDSLLNVNLKSGFFLVQAAVPSLTETKGCVINVSSMNGIRNARHNFVYDSIKAALNHLTRGLALDLREAGIRVNAVMPGGTDTPLLQQWCEQSAGIAPNEAVEAAEAVNLQQPEIATSGQIAEIILFLASGGSGWLSGAVIPADGGYSI